MEDVTQHVSEWPGNTGLLSPSGTGAGMLAVPMKRSGFQVQRSSPVSQPLSSQGPPGPPWPMWLLADACMAQRSCLLSVRGTPEPRLLPFSGRMSPQSSRGTIWIQWPLADPAIWGFGRKWLLWLQPSLKAFHSLPHRLHVVAEFVPDWLLGVTKGRQRTDTGRGMAQCKEPELRRGGRGFSSRLWEPQAPPL